MKKRVAIIEDRKELLDTYTVLLGSLKLYDIAGFETVGTALKAFRKSIPEVLIFDIDLVTADDPFEVLQMLKAHYPPIDLLVLSNSAESEAVFRAIKSGAIGYLVKSHNLFELVEALACIEKGGAPLSDEVAKKLVKHFHLNMNSPLTSREREVLQFLADGKTYTEIAEELRIARETSKSHIRNIYSKLKVDSKSKAILRAREFNYI